MAAAVLGGCAFYQSAPLPNAPDATMQAPKTALDMPAVVHLALERSPDLAALRRKADVALAQAHATELLPDPQVSLSGDRPSVHGIGLTNAYALGLSQDLQALLTLPSRAEGAAAQQKQAELDLLWGEWQAADNAAGLYVQSVFSAQKAALLRKISDILLAQAARSRQALAEHNSTLDVAGSDLSAALDVASQADAAARDAQGVDADLKLQLKFAPDSQLNLVAPGAPAPVTRPELERALHHVADARPDLLALRAGYHAQEEAVRTAILEQFPAINIGFNRASDTSNIQTNGLSVTLNLPIFGSTQAKIRTERATRAQLRAEYQARLDQTQTDAWRIWRQLELLREQTARLSSDLPAFRHMAETSQKAYDAGNLAPATYVLMQTSLATREAELLDLNATLWTDTIALRSLLAMPLFPVDHGDRIE